MEFSLQMYQIESLLKLLLFVSLLIFYVHVYASNWLFIYLIVYEVYDICCLDDACEI